MQSIPAISSPRLLSASMSQPLGQVQIELEGKPLFVSSDSISFLGKETSHSIGEGARWRHPYPQTWSWPPKEPTQVQLSSSPLRGRHEQERAIPLAGKALGL